MKKEKIEKVKWRVLVFPGGMENGLEIWRSLRYCKEIKLFSAASNVSNHAPYAYKQHFIIPSISKKSWLKELNGIVRKNRIDYIFPANDLIIDALIKARELIDCTVLLPESKTVEITRSKLSTYRLVRKKVRIPKIFAAPDQITNYPVFVKPDKGYGSQGSKKIETASELFDILKNSKDLVIQEYLPGKEYTIDCFTTKENKLLVCEGRERCRIRMGTSMGGRIVKPILNKYFFEVAKAINKLLNLRGAWFFQMKEDAQCELKLLEIDVRIAGTMAINRVRGFNFPLMTIFDASGYTIESMIGKNITEIDRSLRNRFKIKIQYNTVYVDLDDTIVFREKLNLELIRFLYQCVNQKKKIVLISKCLESNPDKYLEKLKIRALFNEVIWLSENDSKAEYILDKSSIFIDDSFSQRKEVFNKCQIPTFDPSMIEGLIDDRSL